MEENLHRSMAICEGDPMILLARPISLRLVLANAGLALLVVAPRFRKTRNAALQEKETKLAGG